MQQSQLRGAVRLIVAAIASYYWLAGQMEQATGAFIFGTALNGWLGFSDKPISNG